MIDEIIQLWGMDLRESVMSLKTSEAKSNKPHLFYFCKSFTN